MGPDQHFALNPSAHSPGFCLGFVPCAPAERSLERVRSVSVVGVVSSLWWLASYPLYLSHRLFVLHLSRPDCRLCNDSRLRFCSCETTPFDWDRGNYIVYPLHPLTSKPCKATTPSPPISRYDKPKWTKSNSGDMARGVRETERRSTRHHWIDELHQGARHDPGSPWHHWIMECGFGPVCGF